MKLFPAEGASPAYLKAQRAVIPGRVPVLAVGGVTAQNLGQWLAAGADGAGLGSALYAPGIDAVELGRRASEFIFCLGRR